MEKDLKDILLKDLCARLPYGVKMQTTYIMQSGERKDIGMDILTTVEISMLIEGAEEHKPYLFPLSSMTEEQLNDFYATIRPVIEEALDAWKIDKTEYKGERPITLKDIKADIVAVNWMLKNHFDMNGLIPKGLAIDCTNLNIY